MRLSRAKAIRKHLRFYRIVYGIVPPYKVILDGNFIHMALKVKMDIQERIKKLLLGGPAVLYVPRGVLSELRALGDPCAAALAWAEACCTVIDKEDEEEEEGEGEGEGEGSGQQSGTDAIKNIIGCENVGKYLVATQDSELKGHLRSIPSVGLLFVARAVLLMEPPSHTSKHNSNKLESEKWRELAPEERDLLSKVHKTQAAHRNTTNTSTQQQQPAQHTAGAAGGIKARAKKRAKGPNPLSVLKASHKKKDKDTQGGADKDKDKKKRSRKKKGQGNKDTAAQHATSSA